ncbi:MAG: hypothetical protein QFB86_03875 [Patescibacteria group bacterium]|nr:hypothetical protein [Patescibacteria group bacterium]
MDEQNQSVNVNEIEQLEAIRNHALEMLVPLIDTLDDSPEQKFELLMTAARSSGSPALLQKVLETVQHFEQPREKAAAIVDLLNEVNVHLQS